MHIRSIAAAALAASAFQAQAADLLGDTLTFTRAYPSPDTPFLTFNPVSVSTMVTADDSDSISWEISLFPGQPLYDIDPGATGIEWQFTSTSAFVTGDGFFDGFVVTGFGNDIASVSLSGNTSSLDIQVSHSERQIFIDLSGPYSSGTGFALSVAVVPGPTSAALLTAGLVAVAALARRRQTRAT